MRIHARATAVLALVLAVLFGALSTPVAHAAAIGSVSGTITGPGGARLDGPDSVSVELVPASVDPDQGYDPVATVEVDANRPFAFAAVAPGRYRLHVTAHGAGRYREAWSSPFMVKDGEATQVPSIELQVAGTVSGTVRTADGAYPEDAAFGYVTLQRRDDAGAWGYAESVNVELDGTYEVAVPEPGTYRLQFSASQDKYWARSAPMALTAGSATTVDLTATVSASVSGRISLEGSDDPPNWVTVAAYELRNGEWEVVQWQDFAAPGPYVLYLPGSDARRVRVGLHDDDEVFVRTFWDGSPRGAATIDSAATVEVAPGGSATGKDLRTRRADAEPSAIENVTPPAITGRTVVGRTLTATTGAWSVEGVDVALQWQRDGVDVPGATDTTYVLTEADRGRRISVVASATHRGHAAARVESAAVGPVVAAATLDEPHVWLMALPGRSKVTFLALVWAPGVSPMQVDGRLTVQSDGDAVATGPVRNGIAVVEAARQSKGARTYTVHYSGNDRLEPDSATVRVVVR